MKKSNSFWDYCKKLNLSHHANLYEVRSPLARGGELGFSGEKERGHGKESEKYITAGQASFRQRIRGLERFFFWHVFSHQGFLPISFGRKIQKPSFLPPPPPAGATTYIYATPHPVFYTNLPAETPPLPPPLKFPKDSKTHQTH